MFGYFKRKRLIKEKELELEAQKLLLAGLRNDREEFPEKAKKEREELYSNILGRNAFYATGLSRDSKKYTSWHYGKLLKSIETEKKKLTKIKRELRELKGEKR